MPVHGKRPFSLPFTYFSSSHSTQLDRSLTISSCCLKLTSRRYLMRSQSSDALNGAEPTDNVKGSFPSPSLVPPLTLLDFANHVYTRERP